MKELLPTEDPARQGDCRGRAGRCRRDTIPAIVSRAVAALGCLALASAASAQEVGSAPIVTDRPDATESAVTVSKGSFQLEAGYTLAEIEGVKVHNLGEALLRVGVADRLELRFGINSYQWIQTSGFAAQGLQDSSIGMKLRLFDNAGGAGVRPRVAVLASTSLPTGASVASQDKLQPEVRLAAAWNLSERLALGTNIFYAYTNDIVANERFHQAGATLALGVALTDRWGTYAEYFGTYTVVRDGPREDYLNGGVTFLVESDLQLDARVGYGLNGLDDDYFVGFGSGFRW